MAMLRMTSRGIPYPRRSTKVWWVLNYSQRTVDAGLITSGLVGLVLLSLLPAPQLTLWEALLTNTLSAVVAAVCDWLLVL